jgi:hypothetical protein
MPGAIRVPTKKAPQKRGKTSEAKAPSRTKPAWNEYLTDDTRYKLTEYQKVSAFRPVVQKDSGILLIFFHSYKDKYNICPVTISLLEVHPKHL